MGRSAHAARRLATTIGAVAIVVGGTFLVITQFDTGRFATHITALLTALALVAAVVMNTRGREGWAFALTGAAILLAVGTLFGNLWPNVLPSTTNDAYSLNVHNASSSPYTLGVMSWVALFFTPIVLLYQTWTYWTFRKRVTGHGSRWWPSARHEAAGSAAPQAGPFRSWLLRRHRRLRGSHDRVSSSRRRGSWPT